MLLDFGTTAMLGLILVMTVLNIIVLVNTNVR